MSSAAWSEPRRVPANLTQALSSRVWAEAQGHLFLAGQ